MLPGGAGGEPSPTADLHLLSDVFCLHELPGKFDIFNISSTEILQDTDNSLHAFSNYTITREISMRQATSRVSSETFIKDKDNNGALN